MEKVEKGGKRCVAGSQNLNVKRLGLGLGKDKVREGEVMFRAEPKAPEWSVDDLMTKRRRSSFSKRVGPTQRKVLTQTDVFMLNVSPGRVSGTGALEAHASDAAAEYAADRDSPHIESESEPEQEEARRLRQRLLDKDRLIRSLQRNIANLSTALLRERASGKAQELSHAPQTVPRPNEAAETSSNAQAEDAAGAAAQREHEKEELRAEIELAEAVAERLRAELADAHRHKLVLEARLAEQKTKGAAAVDAAHRETRALMQLDIAAAHRETAAAEEAAAAARRHAEELERSVAALKEERDAQLGDSARQLDAAGASLVEERSAKDKVLSRSEDLAERVRTLESEVVEAATNVHKLHTLRELEQRPVLALRSDLGDSQRRLRVQEDASTFSKRQSETERAMLREDIAGLRRALGASQAHVAGFRKYGRNTGSLLDTLERTKLQYEASTARASKLQLQLDELLEQRSHDSADGDEEAAADRRRRALDVIDDLLDTTLPLNAAQQDQLRYLRCNVARQNRSNR